MRSGGKRGENAHCVSKEFTTENVCTVTTLFRIKNSVGGKVSGGGWEEFGFEHGKCKRPVADLEMENILWTEKRGQFADI